MNARDLPPGERALGPDEADALDRATGVTDDSCHGRCAGLRDWFEWETRALLDVDEAHEILDMVLNRMAADAAAMLGGAR